ncbi:STAS/SEC14 domain-containing protein [candidate division WOR-3 bacterium]|nr:STAS/SEC14 domain-containing protein [candidate division WOR-3 bacterium]
MKHNIYYDSDSQVVVMQVIGEVNADDAAMMMEKLSGLLANNSGTNILADFRQSPNLNLDRQSRGIIQNAAKKFKFGKAALVGVSPVTRMIAKVILAVLGKIEESRFFNAEDEALAWLKGE